MLPLINGVPVLDLSVGMAFEFLIVIALIILFIVSLCSLLQKIRKTYAQENDPRRLRTPQVYSVETPPSYESQSEMSHGIYPGIAPPSYSEHYDLPPPKYDDVIKSSYIIIPPVHIPRATQSHNTTSVAIQ